jgi:polysaccharide export outer membrane protein
LAQAEDEIALPKLVRIGCFVLAASLWAAAQTGSNQSLTVPSLGQQQVDQQNTGSLSGAQFPQVLAHPNPNITNVSPGQEAAETEHDLQAQSAKPLVPSPIPTPEPDTEFQQFVASSLGMKLTIFGESLFRDVPSTFAPLDRAQVTPEYILGPGDELTIRAWGQINVDVRAVVDRSGAIYIPRVGVFNVAGLRYEELHDYLKTEMSRLFKDFQLSVSMGRLRSIQVYIVGQVKRPGTYTISSLSSLVDALFASGGPSKLGSLRRVQLKRNGQDVTTFDLYDLIVHGDKSKDAKLMPGDVIYVPPVGPLVALAGSVNNPGIYELRDHATLAEVIGYAGGLTNTALGQRAMVERIDDHRARSAEEFTLDAQGMARELRDGDIVRFLRISLKFDNAVTLRGNVAIPGRYPWTPGMKVHDLIPERAFLVTDDYWKRQNQLAVDARSGDFRISGSQLKNDVKRLSSEINWEYAAIQRMSPEDLTPHVLHFNLGKAIAGDPRENLELQPNDVITVFAQTDIQVPIAERSKFIHLEGEFNNPGVYEIKPGETLRQLVRRVGGVTHQAYLFGSEFTRESTRIDQQQRLDQYVNNLDQTVQRSTAVSASFVDPLAVAEARTQAEADRQVVDRMRGVRASGRVVLELRPNANQADVLPDLVLEDGDRLLIPSRPATINVIGSVYNSNAFIYRPGKTVGDYLRLAGGATRIGDRGREFIIRADGSTVSKQQRSRLISSSFESTRLMPGDSIIVPMKLDRGAALRLIRDYSTIFGQLGLAAGGIRAIFP